VVEKARRWAEEGPIRPGRRELDYQREAVESGTQRRDGRRLFASQGEGRTGGPGTIQEEGRYRDPGDIARRRLARSRRGQRRHVDTLLGPHAQRRPAGREDNQARAA
jgi:hypothetical protein